MGYRGIKILFLLVFLSSFASSKMVISEPLNIYNLGDRIYVTVNGIRGADEGNLNIDLVCGNKSVNLVRIPSRAFSADEESQYSIPYKVLNREDLEIENLSLILGTCNVQASLGSETVFTENFKISKNISVSAKLDKAVYDPDEAINLEVEAVLENGNLLDGYIEIRGALEISERMEEGKFAHTFSMPRDSPAGEYSLDIYVYDESEKGILNEGQAKAKFEIRQKPTKIELSMSANKAVPGKNFTVGATLFDQSGEKMNATIPVVLKSPGGEESEMEILSGSFKTIDFETNASKGIWKIIASYEDVESEGEFEMEGLQKVKFKLEDNILYVTNVGNEEYNKSFLVKIGDETRRINLNLEKGKTKKFSLTAPNGEYEVVIDDGEDKIRENVILTGRAISVIDLDRRGILNPISITVIIALVLAVGFYFLRKKKSKSPPIKEKIKEKVAKASKPVKRNALESLQATKRSPASAGLSLENYSSEDPSMIDLTKKTSGIAKQSLVTDGEKTNSTILAIKIINNDELNENSREELSKAVNEVSYPKGLVDWRDDFIFIVFSPLFTKTYDNEKFALKAAIRLFETIRMHNKKFNNKIEFNIGVHSGDLVASRSSGKLKYTSIGNTILFARKLADASRYKIIVSEEVRRKMIRMLRIDSEIVVGSKKAYIVEGIKDFETNQAKLRDLLKRMDEE